MTLERRRNRGNMLKDLNEFLTCPLCHGYFVDATTVVDCVHVFCRSCIFKHFESAKLTCPICNRRKIATRPDPQVQALVYKMVPGLYSKEMQRREDFYRSTGVRANSSCSDDSALGDLKTDQEKWMSRSDSDTTQFYSPEDSISLSLEYYQYHLDRTSTSKSTKTTKEEEEKERKLQDLDDKIKDRRYLSCPAAVSMSLLQKFLRMKYALSPEHKVDIIYEGEVLPSHYNLMDVAYTFNWTKAKPMRFFYRIFTPMKIQPIKIINTQSSNGGKQLQIVPVKPNSESKSAAPPTSSKNAQDQEILKVENDQQNNRNKERLMAHLKLQKIKLTVDEPKYKEHKEKKSTEPHCIYEYDEPDKEEIKRFAENRDREWARMRYEDQEPQHVSKKRKKSKHSKSDIAHKRRKIHAEITSQESIKLKVKLTPHNGHKHKHHKERQVLEVTTVTESAPSSNGSSSKDTLAQMRAFRHKSNSTEGNEEVAKKEEDKVQKEEKVKAPEAKTKKEKKEEKKAEAASTSGTSKVVVIEKTEEEKQAQKTFLKTFQSHAEGTTTKHAEKVQPIKIEKQTEKKPLNTYSKPNHTNHQNQVKSLEKKIATLQQQCTIEPKPKVDVKDKKVTFANEKPHVLNSQFGAGFTVSKVETGVKRKADSDDTQDKRPSLEITLINATGTSNAEVKAPVKRPPPAQIPLKRIKNTLNLKSGISIIPKLPDSKCEALDLSKTTLPKPNGITLNGIKDLKTINNYTKLGEKNSQLSNLQMLSKVASEHSILKPPHPNNSKSRPDLPSLQNIRMPINSKSPNLAKLPKLTQINKSHFRVLNNTQIRNMRPSQNQTVRNIPNPSLIVRQQNQNRLNLSNGTVQNGETKEPKILNTLARENTIKEDQKGEACASVK